jgi:hypothetical protein
MTNNSGALVLLQYDIDVFSQSQSVQCKALDGENSEPYSESKQRSNGRFGADPKGAKPLAPGRVAVLGKVGNIPGERRLAWNKRLDAEYVNIILKEYWYPADRC